MSPPAEFISAIGTVIARYVAIKQALGRRYHTQRYLLTLLDRFLTSRGYLDLTPESFSAWCSSIEHLMPSGRRMRMQIVRQFCLYRRRNEPNCFVPDSSQFPPRQPKLQPHVFSEGQITRLLLATDGLHTYEFSPLYPQVARLALVLLYTSGLRRGEVTRLRLGDYDPLERVLLVRDSKFHKSRIIPLSPDAVREIQRYLEDRDRYFSRSPDAPLLIHSRGGINAYSGNGLRVLMRRLFRTADVRTAAGRLPRVHDLRFTFAFHALLRWYRTGADVQARLPALATYMGHVSILSTEYYLPFLDAVAHETSERFDRHCGRFLQTAPDERGDL
jgi:integrase